MTLPLRNLSSSLPQAPEPHDDHEPPLADTSDTQGGHKNDNEIVGQMEKEVDQLLAKLKNAGMEINEEMARIIQEERARIPHAARDAVMEAENRAEISWRRSKRAPVTTTVVCLSLLTIGVLSGFAGCLWIQCCIADALSDAVRETFQRRGR